MGIGERCTPPHITSCPSFSLSLALSPFKREGERGTGSDGGGGGGGGEVREGEIGCENEVVSKR